jgi:hypothetical protein
MKHRIIFPLVLLSLLWSFSISVGNLQAQDPLSLIHEPAQERILLNTVSATSSFAAVPHLTEQSVSTSSPAPGQRSQRRHGTTDNVGFDPATFVRIYEDTKDHGHLEIHNPKSRRDAGSHLSVDAESSIIIVPDPGLLQNSDLSLNKLFMSAVLASGDRQQNVEVVGYSEIGKDKASTEAQRGMAFQTTDNIKNMVVDMVFTAVDILKYVYKVDPNTSILDEAVQNNIRSATVDDALLQRAKDRFGLYQPEIQAIGTFFGDQHNLSIVRLLGSEIFWIDSNSLEQIAKQYQDDVRVAFDPNSKEPAAKAALVELLERTKLVVEDFRDLLLAVKAEQSRSCVGGEKEGTCACVQKAIGAGVSEEDRKTLTKTLMRTCAIETISEAMRSKAFEGLSKLFSPGAISLRAAKAADGNLLTLTLEAVGADGSPVGIPAVFEIDIKKYGSKIVWGPSLLFVRRLGVTAAEASPPTGSTAAPINKINFAPSPGMTFGIAYFKRGTTAGDKFLRGLGPGVGMNVTFMNFNDPSFDLSTQKFVNTTGTNVQVGAGVVGSLFDNKIQFSYGWNLNVEHRRTYFGIGFGFIEIGKELGKYIGKS